MIGSVEVGHVGIAILAGGADTELLAARDVLIKSCSLFGAKDGFLDRAIRSAADVNGSAAVDRVHDVVEDVYTGGYGGRSHDVGHKVDAKVSAAVG